MALPDPPTDGVGPAMGPPSGARFSDAERAYLRSQRLGRLATVDRTGQPQNNPVGFEIDEEDRILVHGRRLDETKKFRNVRHHPQVAFVVDDLLSVDPWRPRSVEVRGTAEARVDDDASTSFETRYQIRITPVRVLSTGLDGSA